MPPRCDVLHLSTAYGGGVETAINSYARATADLKHVAFVRARKRHATSSAAALEVRPAGGSFASYFRQALDLTERLQPQVVHLHSSSAGLARLIPKFSRLAHVVYSPHCFAFERTDLPRTVRRSIRVIERFAAKHSPALIAVSPHEAQLAQQLLPSGKITYVPNVAGSVPKTRTPFRPSVITVGRIDKQKDPRFFADAMRPIVEQGLAVRWIGDGDPKRRAYLESSGVQVLGWLPRDEVLAQVSRHGLYVHSAAWEGAPLTVIEAAAMGLPVISRTLPAIESLGFPCSGDTPAELGEAARRIFANPEFLDQVVTQTASASSRLTLSAQRAALEKAYLGARKAG